MHARARFIWPRRRGIANLCVLDGRDNVRTGLDLMVVDLAHAAADDHPLWTRGGAVSPPHPAHFYAGNPDG